MLRDDFAVASISFFSFPRNSLPLYDGEGRSNGIRIHLESTLLKYHKEAVSAQQSVHK